MQSYSRLCLSLDISGEYLLQRREWKGKGEGESGRGREKAQVGEGAGGDCDWNKDSGSEGTSIEYRRTLTHTLTHTHSGKDAMVIQSVSLAFSACSRFLLYIAGVHATCHDVHV